MSSTDSARRTWEYSSSPGSVTISGIQYGVSRAPDGTIHCPAPACTYTTHRRSTFRAHVASRKSPTLSFLCLTMHSLSKTAILFARPLSLPPVPTLLYLDLVSHPSLSLSTSPLPLNYLPLWQSIKCPASPLMIQMVRHLFHFHSCAA